jgi:hypothetical protein
MTDMVECPADGCDYTGLAESVKGHYSGKQDGEHSGGWDTAEDLLDETETESDSTDSGGSSTEANSPTFPEAEGNRSEDPQTVAETVDMCPECESGTQDIPAGTVAKTDNHGRVRTEAGDRYCADCDVIVTSDGEVVR